MPKKVNTSAKRKSVPKKKQSKKLPFVMKKPPCNKGAENRVGTGYGKRQGSGSTYSSLLTNSGSNRSELSIFQKGENCDIELIDPNTKKSKTVKNVIKECNISKKEAEELFNGLKFRKLLAVLMNTPAFVNVKDSIFNILDSIETHRANKGYRYLPVKFTTKKISKLNVILNNKFNINLNNHDLVNLLIKNSLYEELSDYKTYVCGLLSYLKITKKNDKKLIKLSCPKVELKQEFKIAPTSRSVVHTRKNLDLLKKMGSNTKRNSLKRRSTRNNNTQQSFYAGFNNVTPNEFIQLDNAGSDFSNVSV